MAPRRIDVAFVTVGMSGWKHWCLAHLSYCLGFCAAASFSLLFVICWTLQEFFLYPRFPNFSQWSISDMSSVFLVFKSLGDHANVREKRPQVRAGQQFMRRSSHVHPCYVALWCVSMQSSQGQPPEIPGLPPSLLPVLQRDQLKASLQPPSNRCGPAKVSASEVLFHSFTSWFIYLFSFWKHMGMKHGSRK